MYNEDAQELELTLKGICRNVETYEKMMGPKASRTMAVAIVSDGRRLCNKSVLDLLSQYGLYNAELVQEALDRDENIRVHLFEATVCLNHYDKVGFYPPLRLIFALKEENGGKLDSHRWFFNAFAQQLNPKYCFVRLISSKLF